LNDAGQVVDADVVDSQVESNPGSVAALDGLYKDLILNNDDEAVSDQDRLVEMEDKNGFSIDPTVIVSDDARTQAQIIYDQMTPSQIANYVSQCGEVVPDLAEILMAGLDQCRHLTDADYVEFSDSLAERIAVLTGGLSGDSNDRMADRVKAILDQARPLTDDQFAQQKSDFQHQADRIAGSCFPTDLMAHAIQWDLATFLSNPQAKAMTTIRARQMGLAS
jgi:hypothetical protein